ncbi:MAG: hypothetical protein ACTSVA_06880 [Candidatus Njordarchaeales archaeon]
MEMKSFSASESLKFIKRKCELIRHLINNVEEKIHEYGLISPSDNVKQDQIALQILKHFCDGVVLAIDELRCRAEDIIDEIERFHALREIESLEKRFEEFKSSLEKRLSL